MSRDRTARGGAFRDDVSWLVRLATFAARIGVRIFARVRVVGPLERIPRSGPLIIAPNHVSNADGPLVAGELIPRLGRRVHWLGKREIVRWPVLGRLALGVSVHPVDRGGGDVEAYRTALRVLAEGHVLVVFPEGTRSPSGALAPAKEGVATLAMRAGAPILPVGLVGTHRLWPKGGRPRFGSSVEVRLGEPFVLGDVLPAGTGRQTAKSAGTEAIMRRIAALLPPEQRGVYG